MEDKEDTRVVNCFLGIIEEIKENHKKLFNDIEYCDSQGDLAGLSYAVEDLGSLAGGPSHDKAKDFVLHYLSHKEPIVREGAIMAADRFEGDPDIKAALRHMAEYDSSHTIRSIALETLDYF